MKTILKKVLILTFSLVLFVGLATPISAETNNQSSGDKTEESGPTPSATARRCALSALIGTSLTYN